MKLADLRLRQRDGVTCGPSVAVMAGALLDPDRHAALAEPESGAALFAAEQLRVHADVNRIWPRRLGTTPWGMARALTAMGATAGVCYRWRLFRGRRDKLAMWWRRSAPTGRWRCSSDGGFRGTGCWSSRRPNDRLTCYEPSSGELRPVDVAAVRESRLSGLGYPRPFAFVVPCSNV